MIHEACMPVYIVIQIFSAGGHSTRGSTGGPRGPKNYAKSVKWLEKVVRKISQFF